MADKRFVGTFHSENQVLNKINELKAQGYSEEDIYVVTNDADSLSIVRGQTDVDLTSSEGSWLDKFIAFLSGDEPVRAAFTHMGFTEEESSRYYDEVKNGSILLYVDRDYGSFINDQQTEFQTGYSDQTVSDFDNTPLDRKGVNVDNVDEEHLHLHEERLNVDKERVQTGEVNIGKHVVEEEQTLEVPVSHEEVYIERRAVNDEVAAAGEVLDDGEQIHIPVMEERVEVTKRPVVSEEIVVGKREVQDTEKVRETVRREEADIDRTDDVVNELDRAENETLETDHPTYDPLNDRD